MRYDIIGDTHGQEDELVEPLIPMKNHFYFVITGELES